ncbi:MAG: lipopolysaccharide heptosyltransferase II [Mariprofundaceae bacterium]|nr:lipopolysaccharide heptosyltransferase II [Mariprofundaceae bacterium]
MQIISIFPPNWLGDVIMAQPAMRAIIQHHSDSTIHVVGRPWLEDLLPFLNLGKTTYQTELAAHQKSFLFRNSFHAAWQAFRSGAQERHGFKHECRSLLLTHAYRPKLNMQHEHHRDYFLDLVEQAHIPVEQRHVLLLASKTDVEAGITLLQEHGIDPKRAICVAPGAQFGGAKRYPSQSYAYILKWLSEAGWQPVILGTQAERDIGKQCLQKTTGKSWNASGTTSLRQALQLVASSRLTLCNDSGLMHVSAGLGRPTVGIFGATDPSRTAPSGDHVSLLYQPAPCSPCLKRECSVSGHPCMVNILPEIVRDACLGHLKH